MITYNWIYSCDYCKKKVHGFWKTVDGLLVCPKHRVTVEDRDKEE